MTDFQGKTKKVDVRETPPINLLFLNTHRKIYKESSISYNKMTPSDPKGLLDEIFLKGGLFSWK